MAALATDSLGDVEVGSYRKMVPGSHILLWYSDDDVWHEALVAYVVGGTHVVIHTPDDDTYIEDVGCNGDGPTKMRGMVGNKKVPRGIRKRVYRFRKDFSDDELKGIFRTGMSIAESEGHSVVTPTVVLNSAGEEVTTDAFFGGRFVRQRLQKTVVQNTAGGTNDSPVSPKNAAKVRPAPDDMVWVAAEPLAGFKIGQEVSLNIASDVQLGERTAMALRSGEWLRVDLIPIVEVADYPAKRCALFVPSDPGRLGALAVDTADADEKVATGGEENHGDVRTLWVDYDEHGERYKRWRDVAKECFTPSFDEKPIDGPPTALHLVKFTERQGGDPRQWLQTWMRSKRMEATDRTAHELKVLCDTLYFAGVYDQLNIAGLISLEIVCRRIQAISDAYTNPNKPSWENAKLFTGQGSVDDIVAPSFRSYAVRKNKDELELLQARQKVRELRGSPAVATTEDGDGPSDALPSKPGKKSPKGRGRGGGGQTDA